MDGAPIFDVYDDDEPSMAVLQEAVKEDFVTLGGMRSIEELKANILHEVYDEFQKMKVGMMQEFTSLQETMNLLLEKFRNFRAGGRRSHHTNQNVRVYMVKPSLIRSATPQPRHRRARTVPIKPQRQHSTSQTRKPRRMSPSNSSKPRIGVNSTKPPEHGDLPRSSSIWCRLQASSHVRDECVLKVCFGGYGAIEKRPFDRGKTKLIRKRDRFLVKQSQLRSSCDPNFENKVLSDGEVLMRFNRLTGVNRRYGLRIDVAPKLMDCIPTFSHS